jgi:hypothetical protein
MENYLKAKKVDEILTDLVAAVGRERPEEPVTFMIDYLGKSAVESTRDLDVGVVCCGCNHLVAVV